LGSTSRPLCLVKSKRKIWNIVQCGDSTLDMLGVTCRYPRHYL
jgi:hypothetical protein